MAASNTSGPNESGGLSAREQKVLAEIEYDLFVADPPSPVTWSAPTGPGPGSDRGQPSGTSRATAVPADWWGALGLLATLLLAPWILLFPGDPPTRTEPRRHQQCRPQPVDDRSAQDPARHAAPCGTTVNGFDSQPTPCCYGLLRSAGRVPPDGRHLGLGPRL